MLTIKLNPCVKCYGKAQLISYGYGKDHYGTKCVQCGNEVDSDHLELIARKEWNDANPIHPMAVHTAQSAKDQK